MKYRLDKQEKYTIISYDEPNLNSMISAQMKSDFIFFSQEGIHNLIVDLSAVKFVDSAGLSAILTGNRLFKDGRSFVLTGIEAPGVKKLIEISRLETVLVIVPTMSEAIDYVMMEEMQRSITDEE
jgi:anti-anti-sigma factor